MHVILEPPHLISMDPILRKPILLIQDQWMYCSWTSHWLYALRVPGLWTTGNRPRISITTPSILRWATLPNLPVFSSLLERHEGWGQEMERGGEWVPSGLLSHACVWLVFWCCALKLSPTQSLQLAWLTGKFFFVFKAFATMKEDGSLNCFMQIITFIWYTVVQNGDPSIFFFYQHPFPEFQKIWGDVDRNFK